VKNQPYIPSKSTVYFPREVIGSLTETSEETRFVRPTQIISHEFFVLSDGKKKVYTEDDALSEYGVQQIWNPSHIAYMNLFINGILQPKLNYEVTEGKIILRTEDVPAEGCPIILQMIKVEV